MHTYPEISDIFIIEWDIHFSRREKTHKKNLAQKSMEKIDTVAECWEQKILLYYACTNQGHNFLVREEFTVCMWELHRKRKTMHDSWCSRTNFHCGNTYTHGK